MVSDKEAIKCAELLSSYCLEHNRCEGCIFKPINYKPVSNECLMEYNPPCDMLIELKKKGLIK